MFRNKTYTTINIIGLAVGIAACLLISLVVYFETSFDTFHKNKNHIYRVVTVTKTPQGINYLAGVPMPTAEALRIDYPELRVASIFKTSGQLNILNDKSQTLTKYNEDGLYFVEPQFFGVFDFAWLAGDEKTALTEPNTVVLTQNAAEKYFGNWNNAIGQTIKYDNKNDLKVTGILKNMPVNTDLNINIVVSFATLQTTRFKNAFTDQGGNFGNHYCFADIPDNMTVGQFNSDLAVFAKKHKPADHKNDAMIAQPLSEMHSDGRFGVFSGKTFSKELINALSLIGAFLLIIACVNFINMATAQAVNRSKEIGIRKVFGSNRRQLIFQFIGETFIITLLAVMLAVGLAEFSLPFVNKLLGIDLSTAFLSEATVILFLASVILGVTLMSGIYPAIVLSGFNPITALRNKTRRNHSTGISVRRGLVVLQFSIAHVLVIGTLVIINQMNFFENYSLGFDKDAIVNVPLPNDSVSLSKIDELHNQLTQQPGIKNVSYSFASPSDNYNMDNYFKFNNSSQKTDFLTQFKWADAEYFKLYSMKFVAGGPYENGDSVHGYVVNEVLLSKLGIRDPKEAIGKYINIWDDKTKFAPIVGVVKDFNYKSLYDKVETAILQIYPDAAWKVAVKINTANANNTINYIKNVWDKFSPDFPIEYKFLDENFERMYNAEDKLKSLLSIFTSMAIFIGCLGLFGLAAYAAERRRKEIGIRKVLGATTKGVVLLLSKDFIRLVIISLFIASPIAWYFMNKWLQDFAYRIGIPWWVFIAAGITAALIALATISFQAIKAALANPVKSLRSE